MEMQELMNDPEFIQRWISRMEAKDLEEEKKAEEYTTSGQFEKDLVVCVSSLEEGKCISSDYNDYVLEGGKNRIDIPDVNYFCRYLFHHKDTVAIDITDDSGFCAGERVYKDLKISLIVGQGSYYIVEKYDNTLNNGAGI